MEREAPALIAQLQAGVDHNIMTAEQAGEKLIDYAANLLNKAADDVVDRVQNRTQSLIDYASRQTLALEQKVFEDIEKIIADLHCETQNVALILERQQKIFDENVNSWLPKLNLWKNRKDDIDERCRFRLGVDKYQTTISLYLHTTFKLWRCIRLSYATTGHAASIRDAYDDVVSNGKANICALRSSDNAVALREATETWIFDTQSAKAWDRAIRGE